MNTQDDISKQSQGESPIRLPEWQNPPEMSLIEYVRQNFIDSKPYISA